MKRLVIANWKMNPKNLKEALLLAGSLKSELKDIRGAEVVICPPFPYLAAVARQLRHSGLLLGAQDMSSEEKGAHTGQVSPAMLKAFGCAFVILGHSELRRESGETDFMVNRKLRGALKNGISPVLCVENTIQLRKALQGVPRGAYGRIVVAYEPLWAISTNKGAKAADPSRVAAMARTFRMIVPGAAILYGGSVSSKNAAVFLKKGKVEGFLVGQASLKAEEFTNLVKIAAFR
ncbi:MAG: triose-phosphate isomerase [bacterium]|nr:triose-phosphate isomerase [bacterium]